MQPAPPRSMTAGELALEIGAGLVGDGDLVIASLDVLDRAGSEAMTFLRDEAFARQWLSSRAGAALLPAALVEAATGGADVPAGRALLVVEDADLAMIKVLRLFAPPGPALTPGVDPSAVVSASARIAPTAHVGPLCVVAEGAEIGDGARLIAQVFVGPLARVGAGTTLHPGVRVLERCVVGKECVLHAGVVIGADGFGYRPDAKGLTKVPHIGDVVIGDRVDIGANSCIDRAKFSSTIVGEGTKIDNLVQVGHNCRIGRSCVVCGNTGLAGSVVLEDGVVLGGGVGVADNVTIGAGARVAAYAGVSNDVPAGAEYMGVPAGPVKEWRRAFAKLRMMGRRE